MIAILGFLAVLAIGSFNSARSKARDARRLADARTILQALERFEIDNGKHVQSSYCSGSTYWKNPYRVINGKQFSLVPDYLQRVPDDPLRNTVTANGHQYIHSTWDPDAYGYCLLFSTIASETYFSLRIKLENKNEGLASRYANFKRCNGSSQPIIDATDKKRFGYLITYTYGKEC